MSGLLAAASFDQPARMQPEHWWIALFCGAVSLLALGAFVQCVRQRRAFDRQCAVAQEAEHLYLARKASLKSQLSGTAE